MISFRRKNPDRFNVTAQFVRHNDTRFAKAGDQPSKETLGSFGVSTRLHKDIQHVPVRIHCAPQPLLCAVDRNNDFVQMPFVGSSGTVTLDAIGKMLTKPVHPFAHGFPTDSYTAFSKQVLDIRRAERKAMIGPYSIGNDFTGETKALQARYIGWKFHNKTLSAQRSVSKLAMPLFLMIWNWQQPDWPNWRYDPRELEAFERDFLLGAGRFLGAWQHLSNTDQDHIKIELLSDEAIKTSEIEGEYLDRSSVQSSVRRQFGLTAQIKSNPSEAGIAELMVAIFTGFEQPITHETLFAWHEMVCRAQKGIEYIGEYRKHADAMQVVSGALHKPKVHFEAPPSNQVPAEMKKFLEWLDKSSHLRPLTKAGLAHLYFVSIHPFKDGNGRIGRAISKRCLSKALGQPSLLALARKIEEDRTGYYDALEANNKTMDIGPWLLWFAQTTLNAQSYSIALVDHIIAKTRMLDRLRGQINSRQERALVRMFEAGPEGFVGGLSAKNYMTITGATTPTTTRDLNDLDAKEALFRTGDRKSTRYWLNLKEAHHGLESFPLTPLPSKHDTAPDP